MESNKDQVWRLTGGNKNDRQRVGSGGGRNCRTERGEALTSIAGLLVKSSFARNDPNCCTTAERWDVPGVLSLICGAADCFIELSAVCLGKAYA